MARRTVQAYIVPYREKTRVQRAAAGVDRCRHVLPGSEHRRGRRQPDASVPGQLRALQPGAAARLCRGRAGRGVLGQDGHVLQAGGRGAGDGSRDGERVHLAVGETVILMTPPPVYPC